MALRTEHSIKLRAAVARMLTLQDAETDPIVKSLLGDMASKTLLQAFDHEDAVATARLPAEVGG